MQNYITDTFKTASENTSHTQTATESVINYIRNLILNRELRIGDKLPTENELCEQLGCRTRFGKRSRKTSRSHQSFKRTQG